MYSYFSGSSRGFSHGHSLLRAEFHGCFPENMFRWMVKDVTRLPYETL